jgi:hypothetical protein
MTFVCAFPLGYMTALFAFLAAIAWLVSSIQRLPMPPTTPFMGVSNAGIPELVRKLRIQSRWSAAAAIAAAVAATLQGADSICGAGGF